MRLNIKYAYTSNIGKVRVNNEDNFWCNNSYMPAVNEGISGIEKGTAEDQTVSAFAVFDGMGGESCGEIAASLAAEAFHSYFTEHKCEFSESPKLFTKEISRVMNHSVCAYAEENGILSMGTTAAMVFMRKDQVTASNLGDSRIYFYHDGTLEQISKDHVIHGSFYRKPPLVQFLGLPEREAVLEPSFYQTRMEEGSRILLCTDGVTDMVSDGELGELLSGEKETEEIVSDILDTALRKGGKDNITMILLEAAADENGYGIADWLRGCVTGIRSGIGFGNRRKDFEQQDAGSGF